MCLVVCDQQMHLNRCWDYILWARHSEKIDSAGSDDTTSMIKGGGYIGACTRHSNMQDGVHVCAYSNICMCLFKHAPCPIGIYICSLLIGQVVSLNVTIPWI